MSPSRDPGLVLDCDLAIIGAGLAGAAAALFAARRGLSVVLAGGTGALAYTSGYFDILGAIPPREPGRPVQVVTRPFQALPRLLDLHPGHPYRLVPGPAILAAFAEWLAFLEDCGLPCRTGPGPGVNVEGTAEMAGEMAPGMAQAQGCGQEWTNMTMPSPVGTLKHTFAAPATMAAFHELLAARAPGLLADFHGLDGYSASQAAANLAPVWPGLATARVHFPGHRGGAIYPEIAARSLELPQHQEALAESLAPLVGGAACLGLPALLGMHRPQDLLARLEERLGLRVFELPLMPPGVPGIRVREVVEERLPGLGVTCLGQHRMRLSGLSGHGLEFIAQGPPEDRVVRCRGAVLATGRFLAGGLSALPSHVRETVFDLPVAQPGSREDWHQPDYFDPRGHGVNRCGVEVDEAFHPLGADGGPFHPRLYAAGSILAHADWMRMKCGAGVALSTALGAVQAFLDRHAGG